MDVRVETGGIGASSRAPSEVGGAAPASAGPSRVESSIKARYARRDFVLRRALAGADAVAIVLSTAIAVLADPQTPLSELWLVVPTLPLWLLLFRIYGLYERDVKKARHAVLDDLPNLFHALVIGGLGLWVVYRVAPVEKLAALQVLVFGLASLVLIPLARAGTRRAVARRFGPERLVFLGGSPVIPALVRKMRQHHEYGLLPVGQIRSESNGQPLAGALPQLGSLHSIDFVRLVDEHRIERVIVATDDVDDQRMLEILQRCRSQSLKVSLLPDHVHAMGPAVQIADVEGITLLDLNPLVLSRSSRMLKRTIDVLGAGLALFLLAPVMAATAAAIKLDRGGPVLFRQTRVGKGGTVFRLLKFRTMVVDAEARLDELWALSQDPNWLKLEHDPRITRIGHFLRMTSLDELPQLWNVLRGDMSLVGPRPLAQPEDCQIQGWERTRLDLAPGITGPWQVMGRTHIPFEEMTKLDYMYVTNWSLWLDIKLLLQTLPVVLSRRGAN